MKFEKPIQDYYNPDFAICYGCGPNNPKGLHLKTYWTGEEGICHFMPWPEHHGFPEVVYGGLIASLIDCHSIGTAICAFYQKEGRLPDTEPEITCVTGRLDVSYLKPTPMDQELVLRARPVEVGERKAVIHCSMFAGETETARAEVVAVRVKSRAGIGHVRPE